MPQSDHSVSAWHTVLPGETRLTNPCPHGSRTPHPHPLLSWGRRCSLSLTMSRSRLVRRPRRIRLSAALAQAPWEHELRSGGVRARPRGGWERRTQPYKPKMEKRSSRSFPVWIPGHRKRCSVENGHPGYVGLENYGLNKFRRVSRVSPSLSHQR